MTHYEKKSMNVAAGESKANSFALPSCSNVTERKELRAGQVQFATKYDKVQTKRFVIESSQTTKIQF